LDSKKSFANWKKHSFQILRTGSVTYYIQFGHHASFSCREAENNGKTKMAGSIKLYKCKLPIYYATKEQGQADSAWFVEQGDQIGRILLIGWLFTLAVF
jgi:hypothetical protein